MDKPGRKKSAAKWQARSSPNKSPPNTGPGCEGTGTGSVPLVIDLEPDSDDFEEPAPKTSRKVCPESQAASHLAKTPQTLEPRKVVLLSRLAQESKKPVRNTAGDDKHLSTPSRLPLLSSEQTSAPEASISSESASSLPSTEEWDSQCLETKQNLGKCHTFKSDQSQIGALDNQKERKQDHSPSTSPRRDTQKIPSDKKQSPPAKKKRNDSPILHSGELLPSELGRTSSNIQSFGQTTAVIAENSDESEAQSSVVSVLPVDSAHRNSIRTGQHVSCLGLCEHILRQLKYDGVVLSHLQEKKETPSVIAITDSPSSSAQQLPLLCYPSEGSCQVRITNAEINILQSGLMLNDVLIQFYCLYLQNSRKYNAVKKSSFVNSFFFEKAFQLHQTKSEMKSMLKWKSSKDPLSNDYVFIPVNKALHWSLIILYKVTDEHADGALAYYLDSLGKCPMEIEDITISYLAELKKSHGSPFRVTNCSDTFKTVQVPIQTSGLGCGLYVLHYIEKFLEDPEYFIERVRKSDDVSDWFNPEDAEAKRHEMEVLLLRLIKGE